MLPVLAPDQLVKVVAAVEMIRPSTAFADEEDGFGGTEPSSPADAARWLLRTALFSHPQPLDIVTALNNALGDRAKQVLRDLFGALPASEAAVLYGLVHRSGLLERQSLARWPLDRSDRSEVIGRIAGIISEGEAARLRRSTSARPSQKPDTGRPDWQVARLAPPSFADSNLHTRYRGQLWEDGLTLPPEQLAERITAVHADSRDDALWLVKATTDRAEHIEDWFPGTAVALFTAGADCALALLCHEVADRCPTWELKALVEILEASELPEIADQIRGSARSSLLGRFRLRK